jgi:hypothetical protein
MKYRFVGAESIIADQYMRSFGQVIELDQNQANDLILTHPPALIIPEKDWEAAAISDAEVKQFPTAAAQTLAPPEFLKKRTAVWAGMQKARDEAIKARDEKEKAEAEKKQPAASAPADVPVIPAETEEKA